MESFSLTTVAADQLAKARAAKSGRAAQTVYGGHDHFLRQTVIALLEGRELAEHESPGEATLQVLQGRVAVHAGEDTWDGEVGDFLIIPPVRHSLSALEDSAVLLSVRADSR